jgi:hypothetical protein
MAKVDASDVGQTRKQERMDCRYQEKISGAVMAQQTGGGSSFQLGSIPRPYGGPYDGGQDGRGGFNVFVRGGGYGGVGGYGGGGGYGGVGYGGVGGHNGGGGGFSGSKGYRGGGGGGFEGGNGGGGGGFVSYNKAQRAILGRWRGLRARCAQRTGVERAVVAISARPHRPPSRHVVGGGG